MPFVDTAGARIAYEVAGSGPAVLMIQGIGVAGSGWRPQVEGLRDRFRVISFDNRGIGASALGGGAVDIPAMAADALAVADAAGAQQFHLVGHSMGGVIAQEVALSAGARVASLSLLCTFAHGRQAASLTPAMFLTALRTRLGTRQMRRAAFLSLILSADAFTKMSAHERAQRARELEPLFGHDLAVQPPVTMKQLRATARHDAFPRLGALGTIPTLVVIGGHDRIARPAYGRELAQAIPGARLVEIAEGAHGLPIQLAAQVNQLLAEHFAASAAPGATRASETSVGPDRTS